MTYTIDKPGRSELAQAAADVLEWAATTGGWEAPCWERLSAAMEAERDREDAAPAARDMAYDPATRRITDENGLTVAENVIAQDAALLLGHRLTTPAVAEIIADMLGYAAEQFDGDPDSDLNVSGADLVDAFSEWRARLKAAMGPRFEVVDGMGANGDEFAVLDNAKAEHGDERYDTAAEAAAAIQRATT